ncbi:hypothetical protein CSC82_08250 [Rhodobacteraceae bacterium 4F10]|nr:hypothetical protein CSC82_08250 [Rhodobacteraceae bacterium 4F10]
MACVHARIVIDRVRASIKAQVFGQVQISQIPKNGRKANFCFRHQISLRCAKALLPQSFLRYGGMENNGGGKAQQIQNGLSQRRKSRAFVFEGSFSPVVKWFQFYFYKDI